ncbi:beta-ketoacyl synthase N-terminal-like domain-containing protein [Streptomyces rubradiris]|uniref:beta-ketoacyl synthase N-terminal-like domain-containing protein n=1 Tax=Streptomyces rubradiris TaxID=285531 RepID=UPI003F4D397F
MRCTARPWPGCCSTWALTPFDLRGESYALDSACSGGLMAVANAVFALRAGRCRIAVAGGAQLVLTPDLLVGLCRIGAISRSGRYLPFGAEADGFVPGEGAGILVLRGPGPGRRRVAPLPGGPGSRPACRIADATHRRAGRHPCPPGRTGRSGCR